MCKVCYKNSLLAGLLAALVFPAIAWGAAYLLRDNIALINRPALPYLIAIAINLILLRFLLKRDLDKTARGIMLGTFVIMLLVFMLKVHLR
ncbi:MAG: hypothetical protein ACXVJD_12045 [Mucilaginibacter sp.]